MMSPSGRAFPKVQPRGGKIVEHEASHRRRSCNNWEGDGFAGPGTYAESQAGSPLLILELLASQSIPATASFVEANEDLLSLLLGLVAQVPGQRLHFRRDDRFWKVIAA